MPRRSLKHSTDAASANAVLLDELRTRADAFAKDFARASYEMGEAQEFIRGLCEVYGLSPRRAVNFEERIGKPVGKGINRIDGFFPGKLLVEMKSEGKNLDDAYAQACGYVEQLARERPADLPQYLLVSDFQNLHLYDRAATDAEPLRFALADFRQHVEALAFLSGYEKAARAAEEAANTAAAETLADLHQAIQATDYPNADLEALLVRLLFCLFADDTALFGEPGAFLKLVEDTRADGDDLGGKLDTLFRALDLPHNQRKGNAYARLAGFPYVNGELFKGRLEPCGFDAAARRALIDCASINWAEISPDIFGSLFQAIMHFGDEAAAGKTRKRREFGAHYTSEANIQKVIGPLFLDDLKTRLTDCQREPKKLRAYLAHLRSLHFFDPACGCGNFLVVAYRELRLLEEDALARLAGIKGQTAPFPVCNVDQFFGIEIDPSAAQIATVALWLTDHQMNRRVTSSNYNRLPLKTRANITCGNALRLDWREVCPDASAIMGNPPFIGKKVRTAVQQEDMELIWGKDLPGSGVLDYVSCWYRKAADYLRGTQLTAAFVSTNSIAQGEQVGLLGGWMRQQGLHIQFAHRTFRWNNEGRGVAAVHCVILGFGFQPVTRPQLFKYDNINGDPVRIKARHLNAYLTDAPDVDIATRKQALCPVPPMVFGNMPNDGGNLLLSDDEKATFLAVEPGAAPWIKPFISADEFLNGPPRWCLWLPDIDAATLARLPGLQARIEAVRALRAASTRDATRALAATPHCFGEIRQPASRYILIPRHSSENRRFVPMGFFDANNIVADSCLCVTNATTYHFGILSSTMHNAWIRTVSGRIKSDFRYSVGIVYNNFPWPQAFTRPAASLSPEERDMQSAIEAAAKAVLDARAAHPGQSLAWLYNPDTMPADLEAAHDDLDDAVDAAYGYTGSDDDAARTAFLFERYRQLTVPVLPANDAPAPRPARKSAAKSQGA